MAVWLPQWTIDRRFRQSQRGSKHNAAREMQQPLLVVADQHQRQVVTACCARSRRVGVRAGMAVVQARALFAPDEAGSVCLEPHEPECDRVALHKLAVWAHRFSPVVAIDTPTEEGREPDGLLLDMTGSEAVFDGEERMLRVVAERFGRLRVHAHIAVAPTIGSAWAMARFGSAPSSAVRPGNQRDAIAPLPIAALRLPAETTIGLSDIGIETISQLMDLPRAALPARFGEDVLLQLDRALGHAMETIDPIRPLPLPMAERVFDGPTDRIESIEHAVQGVLDELAGVLRERQVGAREVALVLHRSDLEPEYLEITMARPSCDAQHLWRLLRPKLEHAHLGFGVEGVLVRADAVERILHEQSSHWRDTSQQQWGSDRETIALIDTMRNRMGSESVRHAVLRESHLPERAFAMQRELASSPVALTPNDRPTMLFDHPIPIEVIALTPDGPVHRVRWDSREHVVTSCASPERLSNEWWQHTAGSTRDYYAVRIESGRWLWLARAIETNKWFIHGVWA